MLDASTISVSVQTRSRSSKLFFGFAIGLCLVLFAMPFVASRSLIQDMFFILTMLTLAQWWNLLAGYGGLVSVGQQAFVGIGSYFMFAGIILGGIDPLLAILVGTLAATILAIPTAFFCFRLQGAYFAIGTWVIAEVVRLFVSQWQALGGGTGTSLPRGAMEDWAVLGWVSLLFDVRTSAARDILTFWIALALCFCTITGIYLLLRSKVGLALSAVRDDVEAAESLGVSARRSKWLVFMAASTMTGLTGALIYLQKGRISPDAAFSINDWTAYVIFIVVIGGVGTLAGPIIGVIVFFVLQSLFADFGTWYLLALGLLAILTMLFAPRGIWGLLSDRTGIDLFPTQRHLAVSKPSEED